ncbi:hypothetical protein BDR26DRAFT_900292 [Obelidium mucronatum]|nr:hypothetical protein BDR26DRAFT_900292 [Obelidium mucronatum]
MGGGTKKKSRSNSATRNDVPPRPELEKTRQDIAANVILELKLQNKELNERIQQLVSERQVAGSVVSATSSSCSDTGLSSPSASDSKYSSAADDAAAAAEIEALKAALRVAEAQLRTSAATASTLGAQTARLDADWRAAVAAEKAACARAAAADAHAAQLADRLRAADVALRQAALDAERAAKAAADKDAAAAAAAAALRSLEAGVVRVLRGPLAATLRLGVVAKDLHRFAQDHWAADASTSACSLPSCNARFSVIQRKHHCRCCGLIFCASHSAKRMKLSLATHQYDVNGVETRVCDGCFTAAGW